MPMTIICVTHSTSVDNERHVASGHDDPDLSQVGEGQARELGQRLEDAEIDAVYCFDLRRAYRTAEVAFASRDVPILRDPRCREVDYGKMTGFPLNAIDEVRLKRVELPFPGGESCADTTRRLEAMSLGAHERFPDGTIVLIGNRATYVGLEHICRGVPLQEAVADSRPWQEEWRYEYVADGTRSHHG